MSPLAFTSFVRRSDVVTRPADVIVLLAAATSFPIGLLGSVLAFDRLSLRRLLVRTDLTMALAPMTWLHDRLPGGAQSFELGAAATALAIVVVAACWFGSKASTTSRR